MTEELYEEVEESTEEKESKSAWVRQAVKDRLEHESQTDTIPDRLANGLIVLTLVGLPTLAAWEHNLLTTLVFVTIPVSMAVFGPEFDRLISRLRERLP